MLRFLVMAMFLAVGSSLFAQDKGAGHKIVIGFTKNDTNQQKALLNQLSNIEEVWPDASVEVVTYNQGIDLMLASNVFASAKISRLTEKGIRFVVCGKTMERRKVSKEQLLGTAEVVEAAIPEIVLKQEAGWSYVVGGF